MSTAPSPTLVTGSVSSLTSLALCVLNASVHCVVDFVLCPTCGRDTVAHCGNKQCDWRGCAKCGRIGDPSKPDRWIRPAWARW